jgi:hypothetical protein
MSEINQPFSIFYAVQCGLHVKLKLQLIGAHKIKLVRQLLYRCLPIARFIEIHRAVSETKYADTYKIRPSYCTFILCTLRTESIINTAILTRNSVNTTSGTTNNVRPCKTINLSHCENVYSCAVRALWN